MAADTGIAAIGAALPVLGAEPVASLHDNATAVPPAPLAHPAAAPTGLAQLSTTGKLLAELLQTLPQAAPAAHAVPLLAEPTAQSPMIADAMRKGIAHSGLFYESHLADWVAGQRAIDTLAQEPQASGATDELPAILRQQIDLLDSQPLQWRGELWPGMPLQVQLQVERQTADTEGGTGQEALPDAWTSTLVSELPALGSVTARLRIEGDRLQIRLQAGEPASGMLAGRAAELRDALSAAGLQLQRFDAIDGQAS